MLFPVICITSPWIFSGFEVFLASFQLVVSCFLKWSQSICLIQSPLFLFFFPLDRLLSTGCLYKLCVIMLVKYFIDRFFPEIVLCFSFAYFSELARELRSLKSILMLSSRTSLLLIWICVPKFCSHSYLCNFAGVNIVVPV